MFTKAFSHHFFSLKPYSFSSCSFPLFSFFLFHTPKSISRSSNIYVQSFIWPNHIGLWSVKLMHLLLLVGSRENAFRQSTALVGLQVAFDIRGLYFYSTGHIFTNYPLSKTFLRFTIYSFDSLLIANHFALTSLQLKWNRHPCLVEGGWVGTITQLL